MKEKEMTSKELMVKAQALSMEILLMRAANYNYKARWGHYDPNVSIAKAEAEEKLAEVQHAYMVAVHACK